MPVNKENNRTGSRHGLLMTLADPVLLFTVLVMMALMFHYRDRTTTAEELSEFQQTMHDLKGCWGYGIISYIASWVMFRLFDFMQKHKVIGSLLYLILLFVTFRSAELCMNRGEKDYPLSWTVWAFTPQDIMEYNKFYALTMFILFLVFMASVIYYFNRVRYRILMNFLIFIIPFAVYGKEDEQMPIGFIILMAVGYVLLMVTSRQLLESERTVVAGKAETWKTVGVYAVLFAVISTIIPKPYVEADRSYLEGLISNAEGFTDRLNAMLNVFRDTTDGDMFRQNLGNTTVYYSNASEPMQIKDTTLSTYDYATDSWGSSNLDSLYSNIGATPVNLWTQGVVANALFMAAGLDSSFAEKYGLEEYAGVTLPEPEAKEVTFYNIHPGGIYMPVPAGARSLTGTTYGNNICRMRSGALLATDNDQFGINEQFTFSYIPEGFFDNADNARAVDMLSHIEDYPGMLEDARTVMDVANYRYQGDDEEYEDKLFEALNIIETNSRLIGDYYSILLDYGDNQQIRELAEEITSGCATDYEKAEALEYYFYNNGYRYDLKYVKSKGENVVDFLFDTKVGVCYEYATAMVLMARSIGIPARFCEGYNMKTPTDAESRVTNALIYNATGINIAALASSGKSDLGYVINANDAHGYPELYLKGYGWVSFEPTMTDAVVQERTRSTTDGLSKIGMFILVAAVLGLLLIIAWPVITHKWFLLRDRKRTPKQQIEACMRRICRIYGIGKEKTAQEAAAIVAGVSGADVSGTAALFDRAVYGDKEMKIEEGQKAVQEYLDAYQALAETKKAARKKRRSKQKTG